MRVGKQGDAVFAVTRVLQRNFEFGRSASAVVGKVVSGLLIGSPEVRDLTGECIDGYLLVRVFCPSGFAALWTVCLERVFRMRSGLSNKGHTETAFFLHPVSRLVRLDFVTV